MSDEAVRVRECSCGEPMPKRTVDMVDVVDGVSYAVRINGNVCPRWQDPDHDHKTLGSDAHHGATFSWDAMVQIEEARVKAIIEAGIPHKNLVVWVRKSIPDLDRGDGRYWSHERFSHATGISVERLKAWEKHRKLPDVEGPTLGERAWMLTVWHKHHPKGEKPSLNPIEFMRRCKALDEARSARTEEPVESWTIVE